MAQKRVTIPEWAWNLAKEYFKKYEKALAQAKPKPIKSVTGLITTWIIEKSGEPLIIHLEHFNTYNDHATIRDHKLGLYIDIYTRPEGELWCEHCESTKCEHIRFALTVPEITEPLKKKGWKHKGDTE